MTEKHSNTGIDRDERGAVVRLRRSCLWITNCVSGANWPPALLLMLLMSSVSLLLTNEADCFRKVNKWRLCINQTSVFLSQLFLATLVVTPGSCRMASSRAPLLTSGIRFATAAARDSFWKATLCFRAWPHPQARLLGTSPCPTAEVSVSCIRETCEEFRKCLYQTGTLMLSAKGMRTAICPVWEGTAVPTVLTLARVQRRGWMLCQHCRKEQIL